MPRPGRDRQLVAVRLARSGIAAIDKLAADYGKTRSDVMRLAIKHGLDRTRAEWDAERRHLATPF